jgi:endonuclease G
MNRTTAVALVLAIVGCLAVALLALTVLGRQLIAAPAADGGGPGTPAASAPGDAPAAPHATADWAPHPASPLPLTPLAYRHFSIGYDEQAKNPAWVLYQLQGAILHHGHEQRPATFATEFRTAAHVAHHDYSGSGFDRGHLCPAYAMFSRFGEEGLQSTFVMANVIPQHHDLNAGEWEHLESAISGRDAQGDGWAGAYGPLWIINGPIYDARPATRQLRNRGWVPSACFSVILRRQDGRWDALAFTLPNQEHVAGPLPRYLTTIAAIEGETRLDLLAGLPEPEQQRLRRLRAEAPWR